MDRWRLIEEVPSKGGEVERTNLSEMDRWRLSEVVWEGSASVEDMLVCMWLCGWVYLYLIDGCR